MRVPDHDRRMHTALEHVLADPIRCPHGGSATSAVSCSPADRTPVTAAALACRTDSDRSRARPPAVVPRRVGALRMNPGSETGSAGLHITTRRDGPVSRVRVSGHLTDSGRAYLAALLDLMTAAGCAQIVVHLGGVGVVDAGLLQLLRAARTRLAGRLTVTADRAEARLPLTLVGLDGCGWPISDGPSVGAGRVRR